MFLGQFNNNNKKNRDGVIYKKQKINITSHSSETEKVKTKV